MKNIFVVALLINTFFVLSQKEKDYRYVPFFKSLSIPGLSNQLTKGYDTDEQKIRAIYSWITNNIKYDVDQWLGFNTQHSSARHILLTRKGSAPDFSFLFNELCRYASIPSVIISGYLKNEYTDYGHKYLSDDHSWNAVFVNNEWRLFDSCLDAGKIEYYKRTFAGYFIYGFTLGTSDRLVYKPHFKRAVTLDNFSLEGEKFKLDHAPADPLWQLTKENYSLKEFEKDSSYLLKSIPNNSSLEIDTLLNEERWLYFQKDITEKEIAHGNAAFNYNPLNNYKKAKSLFLEAKKQVKDLYEDDLTKKKENPIEAITKSNNLLNTSTPYLDSNLTNLKTLKKELTAKSKTKKGICKEQYRVLIKSTNYKQKIINSASGINLSARIAIKTISQTSKSYKRKITKDNRYKKSLYSSKTDIKDSIEYKHLSDSCYSSIQKNKENIIRKNIFLNLLKDSIFSTLDLVNQNTKDNIVSQKSTCDLRLHFFDDLDIEIRNVKDSILPLKLSFDSLLIDSTYKNILNAYYKQFTELKKDIGYLYKAQSNYIKYITKYKKVIPLNKNLDSIYEESITSYKELSIQFEKKLSDYKKNFKSLKKKCKTMEEKIKEEKHLFTKEWYIENQLSSIRNYFINKYYKSQVGRSKKLGKDISKLIRQNDKLQKQF